MDRIPKTGELYRHFKDKLYQIVTVAKHSETGEQMVVYQALYGDYGVYVRPLSMFVSEVDHEKYPEVKQKYRFEQAARGGESPDSSDCGKKPGVSVIEKVSERERGQTEKEQAEKEQAEEGLSPLLLPFVEAEDYGQRLEILSAMKGKIRQQELDVLYEALDLPKRGGTIEEQIGAIENYLGMQKKFDGNRLR